MESIDIVIICIVIGILICLVLLCNADIKTDRNVNELMQAINENDTVTIEILDKLANEILKLSPDKYKPEAPNEVILRRGEINKVVYGDREYRACTACNGLGKLKTVSGLNKCFGCDGRGIIFEK